MATTMIELIFSDRSSMHYHATLLVCVSSNHLLFQSAQCHNITTVNQDHFYTKVYSFASTESPAQVTVQSVLPSLEVLLINDGHDIDDVASVKELREGFKNPSNGNFPLRGYPPLADFGWPKS